MMISYLPTQVTQEVVVLDPNLLRGSRAVVVLLGA